ncbi:unnamed protein product [Moneuplotes crassus]|uniref:Uncharacterized protein n=1 Tax=Euplotes crassus TaxID=5936 RepID=A0AAD2D963_EUPCR|nr:unnamed protein product [Moneuplotes crassus]
MWISGCLVALGSLILHTIAAHAKSITEEDRNSLKSAANLATTSGVSMCLLALSGGHFLIFLTQFLGVTLFSGLICYRIYTGDETFKRLVPYGGMLMMLSWVLMAILISPKIDA